MGDESSRILGMCYAEVMSDGTYGEPWPLLDVPELSVAFDTVDEYGTIIRHVGDLRKVSRERNGSWTFDVSDMRCFPVRATCRITRPIWQLRKRTRRSKKNGRKRHGR